MNSNGELFKADNFPERVEGWLNVLDAPASGDISLLMDKGRQLQWRPMYCVLRISSQRLSHSRNEDRGLSKKSQIPSVLRVGGALDDLLKSSDALNQTQDDLEGRERNLTSFGIGNSLEDNSTNRFINFISRTSSQIKGNLRRTRSSSKLDRRKLDEASIDVSNSVAPASFLKRTRSFSRLSKRLQNKWRGIQDRNESPVDKEKSLRSAQSHESLVSHQPIINVTTLDSNTEIRVLHQSSLLSKDHCFLVSTSTVSRYYSCPTSSQMYTWMKHLKRSIDPVRMREFRNLKSVSILISEAKNLSSKLRYFCELALDGQVYGRTTTKAKGEMLFWGEEFHFRNLQIGDKGEKLVVNIFQDIEKKKKKDLSILIGCISLQLSELNNGQTSEKWYPVRLVSDKTSSNKEGGSVSVRIKVKYRSLDILPLKFYSPLLKYMDHNYLMLIGELEQLLSAKEKEEFSILMVNIFRSVGKSEKFLVDAVMSEVERQEKLQNLLRSNSIASKSIDAFMKLICGKYLKGILSGFVATLVDPSLNLEVDNVSNTNELQKRQEKLLKFCNAACTLVFDSSHSDDEFAFPAELKQVFTSLKKRLMQEGHSDDVVNQVISSCFFLRFICPAIMSPSLFGLTRGLAQDREARNCTLVAKAIQGLANFSRFGEGKEEAMTFLNDFVESQMPKLKKFIGEISNFSGGQNDNDNIDVEVSLDLPHDLSLLYFFLKDALEKKQMKVTKEELAPIMVELSECLNEQRSSIKSGSRSDSLEDLTAGEGEGTTGRRRTMREIQESGAFISFTSLQNISDQGLTSNGYVIPVVGPRVFNSSTSTEPDAFDRFSVSSMSRVGKSDNSSSSCLDAGSSIMGTLERPCETQSMLRKSNERPHTTFGSPKNIANLEASLQSTYRETILKAGDPQRATIVYAAETEIDCNDNATTSWKPLTPQGHGGHGGLNHSDKLQITFNIPRQSDGSSDLSHYSVSSLKRQPRDQQPLIFSNPGFGLKSSLSQSSLKSDTVQTVRPQSPIPCKKLASLPPGCDLVAYKRQTSGNAASNDMETRYSVQGNAQEMRSSRENYIPPPKDSLVQASRSMEFTVAKPSRASNSPGLANDPRNSVTLEVRSIPSPGDASFSGRGDIGFNIKSNSQNWQKVSGVTTMPRKSDGSKDHEGLSSGQKVADLKWMLQQEREARCRMESEYERRLRISEQERKKMESKSYEDKKLIDALQRQVRELEERTAELESRQHGASFDGSQYETRVGRVARKWPKTPPTNVGAHMNL